MVKHCKISCFILGVMGIILDVIVNTTDIYWISVSESYMDTIFAGIITISILCFTFFALISSFFDNKYLGYKLKDVIHFPNSPVYWENYIMVSLLSIIIGVCLLVLNFRISCVNSMTALLSSLVLLEANIALKSYRMITDEFYVYKLVYTYFGESTSNKEMKLKEFQAHMDRILGALSNAIDGKKYDEKDKICEMLSALSTQVQINIEKWKNYDFEKYFDTKVRVYMDKFAKVFGYNEMVIFIINIYMKIDDSKYSKRDLFEIPLKNMRFWNDQLLLENNYFDQIIKIDLQEVYIQNKISNSEIESALYVYFDSLINNRLCTESVRKQLIEDCIATLMKGQWTTNEKGVEPDVNTLLNILNKFVLNNDDLGERKYIFQAIIRQAFYNSIPFNQNKYFDFLSRFFQAFYAFIFCEKETLNENYREELKKTFITEFSSPSIPKMCAPRLLQMNIQGILSAFGRIIQKEVKSQDRRFEKFHPYMAAKTTVWTLEFNIDYMFMLYVIFIDEVGSYGIENFISWSDITAEDQRRIFGELLKKFDIDTGKLQECFMEQCKQYEDLIKHSGNIREEEQKKLFSYVSEKYTALQKEKASEIDFEKENITNDEVMTHINTLMEEDHFFGWDPEYCSKSSIKFNMQDRFSKKEYRSIQTTARTIQNGIVQAVNSYIRQYGKKLVLSLDLEGINDMYNFISETKYDTRNYTFKSNWPLGKYRGKKEFLDLEEKENLVDFVQTPQIYEHLYFNREKFRFNAKISEMKIVELNDKECEQFIENLKKYNGLYNVDGALLTKEEAMKMVKQLYCKERYSFELMTSLNNNDVTYIAYIDFKHTV